MSKLACIICLTSNLREEADVFDGLMGVGVDVVGELQGRRVTGKPTNAGSNF